MHTAIGVFSAREAAEAAYKELIEKGVPAEDIVFVTRSEGESATVGKELGATVGGFMGFAGGMSAGVGAAVLLAVPGIGQVVALGFGAAALLGLAGVGAGSALGKAASGKGELPATPEEKCAEDAAFFRKVLMEGRSLVVVRTESDETAALANEVLSRTGIALREHTPVQLQMNTRQVSDISIIDVTGRIAFDEASAMQSFSRRRLLTTAPTQSRRMLSDTLGRNLRSAFRTAPLYVGCIALAAICAAASPFKSHKDDPPPFLMQVEAPPAEVLKAVEEVTQDQIIHGTYSYDKERILYGAHSASAAHFFGVWQGQGTAFYKVADKVLAPRYFKDSGDIGTVSVRYVVQQIAPTTMTIQIDAVFVDARNVHHPSLGNVESSEFAAIQEHIKNIGTMRRAFQPTSQSSTSRTSDQPMPSAAASAPAAGAEQASATPSSLPELQKQVAALRHQVELRVKEQGAQLKSSPFHRAATLQTLPAASEVLVVVLSPYWYGVETEDGHRGWVHHSQLEPLP